MKSLLMIILAVWSSVVFAQNCAAPMSLADFKTELESVRARFFSDIPAESLGLKTFRSDAYFLQAQPYINTLIKSRSKRRYNVQLNLKLLDCPPTDLALEAILIHELEHVRDYLNWSSARIVGHGASYALSCGKKVKYERETDKKVVALGRGEGLAQYREWVYQWLTPKDLAKKRKIYLTPEEIRGEIIP